MKEVSDKMMDKMFNRLGDLDSEAAIMSNSEMEIQPALAQEIQARVDVLNERLPSPIEGSPSEMLILIADLINKAIAADVLGSELTIESIDNDMDIYKLLAKLNIILRNKSVLKDFVQFVASAPTTPVEEAMSIPKSSKKDDLMSRLTKLGR